MLTPHGPLIHALSGVLLFAGLLLSCQGTESSPIDRSSYAPLFEARDLELLVALDRIEDDQHLAAAPWLLWLQRNASRNLPERSRAAATLARMGFAEGEGFCLAILGAWLPDHEAQSRKFGIPRSERMAFAREIALLALQDRIEKEGRSTPPYDVNQGVPQMKVAVTALEELMAKLPPPRPVSTELGRLYPESPPAEWTRSSQSWSLLRTALLDMAASPKGSAQGKR